jgi:hypothetical protein
MDHSSVYKITFFSLHLSLSVLDPAWLGFGEGFCIYTDINFFHIFNSQRTSKHKENEQTRKTIESRVLEKYTNIKKTRSLFGFTFFYGQDFIQTFAMTLGRESSDKKEEDFFFISFNSFENSFELFVRSPFVCFELFLFAFLCPKVRNYFVSFGRKASAKYNKNKPLL